MKLIYQRFGSEDSQDIDIVFFVNDLPPTIQAAREKCQLLAKMLQQQKGIAENLNVNLAKVESGVIVGVFKGLADETNNALLATYSLHSQAFENQIQRTLPRDVSAKCERTARVLLSYLTKTKDRSSIKAALQGDFSAQLSALRCLQLSDYETVEALGNTNTLADFQKTFAFQLGQTLALLQGEELFTKREIAAYYPDLRPYLNRTFGLTNEVLQKYLTAFANP